jgi:cytochrome c
MRLVLPALALVALTAAGCYRPGNADQAATNAAPAPAPVELTPAQRQAALAALPAPYNQANLENGENRFALCRSCHTITQGGTDMTGPNLFGVMGRQAGTKPGYNYSQALRTANFVWDGPHLNTWLEHPQTTLPGTRMTFAGIPNADDRRDVIAYLMVEGAPPPAAEGAATNAASATNQAPAENAAH